MKWSTQLQGGRARGNRINVSPKHCMEICNNIRHKPVNKAVALLERVVRLEERITFYRFNSGFAHSKGGVKGRYPVKASRVFLKLIENAVNNAEQKGMDKEKLVIVHAAAHKGVVYSRRRPKGRMKTANITTANIELVLQ